MEQWDHRVKWVPWAKGEHLDCLVYLEQRETLEQGVLKGVLVFKVPEERLVSQEDQVNLVRWVLLERMETMEKKEHLEFMVLPDLQDFQDPEVSQVLMVALGLQGAREWQGSQGKWA